MEITNEMFEGLNFDERLKLRRKLIAKYGSSLPQSQADQAATAHKMDLSDRLPSLDINNTKQFEKLKFDERLSLRRKMIAKYGTSLPSKDANQAKLKQESSKNRENANIAPYEMRVQKRRLIMKLEKQKSVSRTKLQNLLENKIEYINDPNIMIDEDANICYIAESKVKEKVVYEEISGWRSEIMVIDDYDGGWGSALKRADMLGRKTKFPVVYIPWDDKHQVFPTYQLDEIKASRHLLTNKQFRYVREKLTISSDMTTELIFYLHLSKFRLIIDNLSY